MYQPVIHTLWLIHLIDTYTMTDTPDWYKHYDWYTWLIHTQWLTHLIHTYTVYASIIVDVSLSVCINQGYQSIVYLSIRCVSHSVCINHYRWQTRFIHTLWLIYLIDTYTMTDTPDSYIHYHWHTWFIHTIWLNQVCQS
jgi:hypothetical protein